MKKFIFSITVVIITGCASQASSGKGVHNRIEADNKNATAHSITTSDTAKLTFLDTINNGNEISLEAGTATQKKVPEKNEKKLSSSDSITPKNESVLITGTRFYIQIMASSQKEPLRLELQRLQSKTSLPVIIIYESPYFKLLAGNFENRTSAEASLSELKKNGYPDSWILKTESPFKEHQ